MTLGHLGVQERPHVSTTGVTTRRTRPEVYGSVDAVTFRLGITAECLAGIETGHRELPGRIDWWMDR